MPSRQDQLHSYQFMVQRVVAALVTHETDPARSPFRRIAGATLAGVLFAALGLGGALAYGLFVPGGSKSWKNAEAVVLDKESAAVYVYRKEDGKLYPVLNYASARLIIGSGSAKTVTVAHGSLNGVPRGEMLGIAGAPASLPPSKQLSGGAWTVCSDADSDGRARSTLFVAGGGGEGGRALTAGEGASPVLVATPEGVRYVIIGRYKHLIRDPDIVLPQLVWTRPPVPVATAFINTLPAGADLARIAQTIPGFGDSLKKPAGGKVGQVYSVRRPDDSRDYYVASQSGLASLTRLQKDLLLADPLVKSKIGQSEPTDIARDELARFGHSFPRFQPGEGEGALPASPGNLDSDLAQNVAICATVSGPRGATAVRVGVRRSWISTTGMTTGSRGGDGAVLADRAVVRPGYGVLVTAMTSENAPEGAVSLVTDSGKRYAIPSDQALSALGYSGAKRVRMPAELVSLLPPGPALDPTAARERLPVDQK